MHSPSGANATRLVVVRVYAVFVFAAAVVAAVVAVALPATARVWLDFGFGGVPATLTEAGSIFLSNVRVAAAPLAAAAAITEAGWHESTFVRRGCDVLLLLVAASNVLVVGTAVGAYGCRMVLTMLPHGPVEVLGFSLAASVYLRARQGDAQRPELARLGAAAAAVLAVAALMEAFLTGPSG